MSNTFVGATFKNSKVDIDGKTFKDCTFINCELIFSGGEAVTMDGCEVGGGSKFGFAGAAANTLDFLHAMNHGGFRSIIHSTIVALSSPSPMPTKPQ